MSLLTTGQFAQLCGTTKDTLFLWDRRGLLKPYVVLENGYRRYRMEQFYEFELITLLKSTGNTLEEIGSILKSRTAASIMKIFLEKRSVLAMELKRLQASQLQLENLIESLTEAQRSTKDQLKIEMLPNSHLYLFKTLNEAFPLNDEEGYLAYYREWFMDCFQTAPVLPAGVVVSKQALRERKQFGTSFFINENVEGLDLQRVTKPAGLYASYVHEGDVSSHSKAFNSMLDEISAHNYETVGNMYMQDLRSQFFSTNIDTYMVKYQIQIKLKSE